MLKKLLASLALTVGIIHPSIASETILTVSFEAVCISEKSLSQLVDKFKEDPMLTMVSVRETSNNNFDTIPAVLFMNPKTKTWTMVEKVAGNLYCVIGTGEQVRPYLEKGKK